jgi:lipopolysaccharide export LptBFGC system permease protein LptF
VGSVIPVAYLFSVLIGVSRAHSEGETLALQTSGISLLQAFGPVAVLSLLVSAMSVYFSMYPVPQGNRKFELMISRFQQEKVMEALRPGVFIGGFHGLTLYAEQVIPAKNEMRRVFLFDDRDESHPLAITAKKAVIISAPYEGILLLRLSDGSVYEDEKKIDNDLLRIDFDVHDINLSHAPLGEAWRDYSPLSFNYDQLRQRMSEINPVANPVGLRTLQVEFHRRISLGLSCFVFGALGFFLSLLSQKGVRGGAILLCTVVGISYYLFLVAANALSVRGWGAPWVLVWAPNILFGALAFWAYRRVSR